MANEKELKAIILIRNDKSSAFETANPLLKKGELAFETDTGRFKLGDGSTLWNKLPYSGSTTVVKQSAPLESDYQYNIGTLWINNSDPSKVRFYILVSVPDESTGIWSEIPSQNSITALEEKITAIETGTKAVGKAKKLETPRTIEIDGAVTGSSTFDGTKDITIIVALPETGVKAGTYTKITVNKNGIITAATQLTAADIPNLNLSKISDAGTAASKNVGTLAGQIPILNAQGQLENSIIPPVAITKPVAVASIDEMLALEAQIGDIAIVAEESKSYILKSEPATEKSNWLELKSPDCKVISVNGKDGVVNLTTSDVAEGSNLYFTAARFSTEFNKLIAQTSSTSLKDGANLLTIEDVLILNGGDAGGN